MFSLFQSAAVSPNPTIVSHLKKRSISGVLEIGKIKKILNILFHQNSKMFQEESNWRHEEEKIKEFILLPTPLKYSYHKNPTLSQDQSSNFFLLFCMTRRNIATCMCTANLCMRKKLHTFSENNPSPPPPPFPPCIHKYRYACTVQVWFFTDDKKKSAPQLIPPPLPPFCRNWIWSG